MIALLALALGAQVQAGIPAWTLSPAPTVTIEDDGSAAKQFVNIVGVARLSKGRIAVIDSTGRAKAQVSVPGGSRVREVGLDYVLLVHMNEDDVESVGLHTLTRR